MINKLEKRGKGLKRHSQNKTPRITMVLPSKPQTYGRK